MNDHPGGRDRDLAPIGALLGHPARAAMLAALADGRALPAGELARHARVRPATATAHLHRLVAGGLVRVHAQGRHRYHELAGPDVAAALEALALIAPPVEVRSLRQDRAQAALAEARTCYDHLAGRRGVQLRERLLDAEWLRADQGGHALTEFGAARLAEFGIDVSALTRTRRMLARGCIDWTQRREHLAGALPAAITTRMLALGWLTRTSGRGLRVAAGYDQYLEQLLGPRPVAEPHVRTPLVRGALGGASRQYGSVSVGHHHQASGSPSVETGETSTWSTRDS